MRASLLFGDGGESFRNAASIQGRVSSSMGVSGAGRPAAGVPTSTAGPAPHSSASNHARPRALTRSWREAEADALRIPFEPADAAAVKARSLRELLEGHAVNGGQREVGREHALRWREVGVVPLAGDRTGLILLVADRLTGVWGMI